MRRSMTILLVALLALAALGAGEAAQQKPVAKKRPVSAKSANYPAKPDEPSSKRAYAELSINELVVEDPNRWTDKMSTHAAVGGFVTHVTKLPDGDTEIRICENPKVADMDRAHCILAKCIPKLPCDVPQIGKPITVKGITRYDAKAGAHWWEIHPVELIEK